MIHPVIVGLTETCRAQPQVDLVAGKTEVADHQIVLGKASEERRLQPTIVLHPIGQRVADQADVRARPNVQCGAFGKFSLTPRRSNHGDE